MECKLDSHGKFPMSWDIDFTLQYFQMVRPTLKAHRCQGSGWSDQRCCLPEFCMILCHFLLRLNLEPWRTKSQTCQHTNQNIITEMHLRIPKYFITDTDVTLTLQADPPWRWPQTESWRPARCRFRLSRTLGRWLNSSVSERYPLPGLWLAPRGKGRVWTHGLTSAPGWGLRLRGRGWGSQEFEARSARWNSAAHCWVHCHPIKTKRKNGQIRQEVDRLFSFYFSSAGNLTTTTLISLSVIIKLIKCFIRIKRSIWRITDILGLNNNKKQWI